MLTGCMLTAPYICRFCSFIRSVFEKRIHDIAWLSLCADLHMVPARHRPRPPDLPALLGTSLPLLRPGLQAFCPGPRRPGHRLLLLLLLLVPRGGRQGLKTSPVDLRPLPRPLRPVRGSSGNPAGQGRLPWRLVPARAHALPVGAQGRVPLHSEDGQGWGRAGG